MGWIPVYEELKDHPKLKRLSRALKVSRQEAVGYLVYLWWWVAKYAPDGQLNKYDDFEIEDSCDWTGKEGFLLGALKEARFIKETEEGLIVNDWHEHTGKFIERSQKQKEKMKVYREKQKEGEGSEEKISVTLPLRNSYITDTEQLYNCNEEKNNGYGNVMDNHTNNTNSTVPTVPIVDDVVITRTREEENSEEKEKSAVEEIADHLFVVTGRTASTADYISITETLNSPDAPENLAYRINLIKITMAAVARQKKNKDPSDGKINSFSYFQKPILGEFHKKKAIQERGIKTNRTREKDNRYQSPTGGLKDLISLDE